MDDFRRSPRRDLSRREGKAPICAELAGFPFTREAKLGAPFRFGRLESARRISSLSRPRWGE